VSKIPTLERWIESANRRPKLWLTALALLMAVQVSPWLYPAVDGCLYLKTIRDFFSADKLSDFHCYVPPGYLPLIAPAFAFGDRPFLAVSILQWLMAVALIGGLYVWARRQFPATAVLFTAVVMVNISMWTYYRRPLKEVASMALMMWIVNLMHVLLEERHRARVVWLTLAVALLTTYLTLIRYAAITVAIGFALAACWRARQQAFGWGRAVLMSSAIGLSAGGALAGWLYYDKEYGGGGIYWHEVASVYWDQTAAPAPAKGPAPAVPASEPPAPLPQEPMSLSLVPAQAFVAKHGRWMPQPVAAPIVRFLHGLVYRVNDIGCIVIPGLWKAAVPLTPALTAPMALFFVLFVLMAVGWRRIVRRKIDVLALTFPAYIFLYAHWVCDQPGGRFMLPMLPVITASVWYGIGPLIRRPMTVFVLLILAHIGQSTAYWLWIDAPRAYQADQNWSMVDRLAEEIRRTPGEVAIADAAEPDCQGLWLELDWRYRLQRLNKTPGPQVKWIVEPAGKKPVAGYSVHHVDGPVQLLCRQSRDTAHTSTVQQGRTSAPAIVGNP
jgi:hypothetical protein